MYTLKIIEYSGKKDVLKYENKSLKECLNIFERHMINDIYWFYFRYQEIILENNETGKKYDMDNFFMFKIDYGPFIVADGVSNFHYLDKNGIILNDEEWNSGFDNPLSDWIYCVLSEKEFVKTNLRRKKISEKKKICYEYTSILNYTNYVRTGSKYYDKQLLLWVDYLNHKITKKSPDFCIQYIFDYRGMDF